MASLSASHIYNLRRTAVYREHHVHHTRTRSRAVAIGERRRPNPCGRPGYLRVDTVHQGDTAMRPGLYHVNAVDTVTQWQVVGCCQTISEAHLIPVLEAVLSKNRIGEFRLADEERGVENEAVVAARPVVNRC